MKKSIKVVFLALILLSLLIVPVFAASSSFFAKAKTYYDKTCPKRNISNEESLECYVFDKVAELQISLTVLSGRVSGVEDANSSQDQKITDLQDQVASQDAKIDGLTSRINALEDAQPHTVTLANNLNVNGPNGQAVQIPDGYKSMTVENALSGTLNGWSPQVSYDGGTTWYEQHRFGCGNTCQTITIPILGPLYRFSPGGGSGAVTSIATLNKEPNAKVILFGQGANYPFTSSTFNTTGYSKIVITAGGGDNPQHLTSISLQRDEGGGSFGQTSAVSCDGGAMCQLMELSLINGVYRIVVNGSGTNALFGAILRP